MSAPIHTDPKARKSALDVLCTAAPASLAAHYARLAQTAPAAEPLRGPEAGMVMLRGRIGGGGALFNLGEATVTRASVRLASGEVGHAMVLGRDEAKASMAAHLDALGQRPEWAARIAHEIVEPLQAEKAEADRVLVEETQATRVDFFTLARGED